MHIALLTGGISAERPITLRSCEGLKSFIAETEHTCDVYDIPTELDNFLGKYQEYDIIFPYIHGRYGEDGIITGLCETLGLRYIGSPSITHALCIDKFRTNCVVQEIEKFTSRPWQIHIPNTWFPGITSFEAVGISQETSDLLYPLIVKPNTGGSSTATSKVTTYNALLEGMQLVKDLSQKNIYTTGKKHFPHFIDQPIIQECIEGEEYTVGVVGSSDNPEVLPIMQIVNVKSELFDWKEKYESDGTNEIFPENLDPELKKHLEAASIRIYSSLRCSGIARIDYRVRDGEIFFLEVNTFPGATNASFVPKMWRKTGRSMGEFITLLIETALGKN